MDAEVMPVDTFRVDVVTFVTEAFVKAIPDAVTFVAFTFVAWTDAEVIPVDAFRVEVVTFVTDAFVKAIPDAVIAVPLAFVN
jgi:hypothetical protein